MGQAVLESTLSTIVILPQLFAAQFDRELNDVIDQKQTNKTKRVFTKQTKQRESLQKLVCNEPLITRRCF